MLGGWEIDPNSVIIGERIAMGGFAEVFIGKYEVILLRFCMHGMQQLLNAIGAAQGPHALSVLSFNVRYHPRLASGSNYLSIVAEASGINMAI